MPTYGILTVTLESLLGWERNLGEIATVFYDLFAKFLSPGGALPPGSVIMIGNLLHLGRWGLNYIKGLVRTIGSLSLRVGLAVEIVPLVFCSSGGGSATPG
jgi:hypothetical protein